MKKIQINITEKQKSYDIDIFNKFAEFLHLLKEQIGKRDFVMVTDENVFGLTPQFFSEFNEEDILVLPAGEEYKTWGSVEKILNKAFEKRLDRSSVFVAVGGGVVGDMTGFASSIFMRGTNFIQVPTTLLAMVDASVGGKTGFDNEFGKNLVGAFHQPERIFCCREFLNTLQEVEIKNGLAEMVKHGILGDAGHFYNLKGISEKDGKLDSEVIFPLVSDSINIKKKVVEQDEQEHGVRAHLNLGHTFGHAIELLSNFQIPHGRGVAIGMVMAAEYAREKGFCGQDVVDEIREVFENFGLDLRCDFSEEEIFANMIRDKKIRHGQVKLILPMKVGEVFVYGVDK